MRVPSRMVLRVKRLRALTTMRRERRKRFEDAERRHPDATALLSTYEARGGSNGFVASVARRYRRHGWLSDRQAAAVWRAVDRGVSRGRGADAADKRRRERGAELYRAGKVRQVGEGIYEVEGSGDEPYRVSLDPENCPCPDAEKGHRCKHVYGALAAEKGEASVGG